MLSEYQSIMVCISHRLFFISHLDTPHICTTELYFWPFRDVSAYTVKNYIVHLLACFINCQKKSNDVHCNYLEETLHTNLNIAHCLLKSLACNTFYNISGIASYLSSREITHHERWSHVHDYSTTTVITPCCCMSLCVTGKMLDTITVLLLIQMMPKDASALLPLQ